MTARGHIRKRGNRYQVIVSGGFDDAGNRIQLSASAPTKKDAEKERTRLLAQVDAGRVARTRDTFSVLLDRWLELVGPSWSPSTLSADRYRVNNHLKPNLGDLPVSKLTARHLDDLYGELRDKGLSAATVRRVHDLASRCLKQSVRWGLIPSNPADLASPPVPRRADLTLPKPEDVRAIIAAAPPDMAVMLRLLAATGARRAECCALKWSDIDGDQVTIARSVTEDLTIKSTKGGGARVVGIDAGTAAALEDHRIRMAPRGSEWVFSHPKRSGPWRPNYVTLAFVRLRRKVGAPDTIRLHDLRHWSLATLLDAGVPLAQVSARGGHSRQSTTVDIYNRAVRERDDRAAQVMGHALD